MNMPEGYKNFSKTKPIKREHFLPVDEWWQNRWEIRDEGGMFKSRKYSAEEIAAGKYSLDLCGFQAEERDVLSPEETLRNGVRVWEDVKQRIDGKLAEIMRLLEAEE